MVDARPAARLTVLSCPSGVGRHRVVELVRARSPEVWLPPTLTTRTRRARELDGFHRSFVDRDRFERMRAAGELLEWAQVGDQLYGTARRPVEDRLREGRPVLLSLDPAGAQQVRQVMPGARLVRLASPVARGELSGGPAVDMTVVNDSAERAANELVGLLGSPALL
jgi:guanylate kinase